ncbi:hypothetical protein IWQ60_002730 [Tieghemiomyces parasiticus]|uniref:Uncharacterized protein n=1 Tax=Tieghemiomyces parasiticus TaxID=78921 RepID=A0A9W8AE96_9FUNG|nr:hypothetical protein IWQ60_002730 [Tieghemiomyces parasiticus]
MKTRVIKTPSFSNYLLKLPDRAESTHPGWLGNTPFPQPDFLARGTSSERHEPLRPDHHGCAVWNATVDFLAAFADESTTRLAAAHDYSLAAVRDAVERCRVVWPRNDIDRARILWTVMGSLDVVRGLFVFFLDTSQRLTPDLAEGSAGRVRYEYLLQVVPRFTLLTQWLGLVNAILLSGIEEPAWMVPVVDRYFSHMNILKDNLVVRPQVIRDEIQLVARAGSRLYCLLDGFRVAASELGRVIYPGVSSETDT